MPSSDTDELKYSVRAGNQHAQMWKWQRRFSVSGGWARYSNAPSGPALFIPRPPPPRPPRAHQYDIVLVRVSEANVSVGPPVVQLVKAVNASGDVVGDAFPCVTLTKKATNNEFYAFLPTVVAGQPTYAAGAGDPKEVRWAELKLSGLYPCDVNVTAGTAANTGDGTTTPGFAYDVFDPDTGATIATAMNPEMQRAAIGVTFPAKIGTYRVDSDGNVVLWWVDEVPDRTKCGTPS